MNHNTNTSLREDLEDILDQWQRDKITLSQVIHTLRKIVEYEEMELDQRDALSKPALQIGDCLRAVIDIDRFPQGLVPSGDILVVVNVEEEYVLAYNTTRIVEGFDEWNNCVQFDKERPWHRETEVMRKGEED
jgi:hypothetical protein